MVFPYIGVVAYANTNSAVGSYPNNSHVIKVYTVEEAVRAIEIATKLNSHSEGFIAIVLDESIDLDELEQLLPAGIGRLTVYVGTLIVGWVIDGVVITVTGQAPGDWAAQAITAFRNGMRGFIEFSRNPRPLPNYIPSRPI